MEPEVMEAFERYIYGQSFIVCSPEMWYDESILVTDELNIVDSYLDSICTIGSETPIIIHGVILPARMIQQELSKCTNIFILTFSQTLDSSSLYEEMNIMLDGQGIVLDAKVNEITFEHAQTNMLEHITQIIEDEMDKDNLDIDDVFLIAGYKPKATLMVDEGTVDASRLEAEQQIAAVAQDVQNHLTHEQVF